MTIQDFVSLSGEVLTQYYDNNITPFLDACHEDVLWIGPAEKQVIRTKKALGYIRRAEAGDCDSVSICTV